MSLRFPAEHEFKKALTVKLLLSERQAEIVTAHTVAEGKRFAQDMLREMIDFYHQNHPVDLTLARPVLAQRG